MNQLEEECARLTVENRMLHLPNSGCEERNRQIHSEGEGTVLIIVYAQRPGFFQRVPYDTGKSLPPDISQVRYSITPCHGNVHVRVPLIQE